MVPACDVASNFLISPYRDDLSYPWMHMMQVTTLNLYQKLYLRMNFVYAELLAI
jgi:hypothetical protein